MVAPAVIGVISCIACSLCCVLCLCASEEHRRRKTGYGGSCFDPQGGQISREQAIRDMQFQDDALMAQADRIERLEAYIKSQAKAAAEKELNGEKEPAAPAAEAKKPAAASPPAYLHPAVARQLAAARPIFFQSGCGPYAGNPMGQNVPMGPYGPMNHNCGVPGYWYR
jgi:hypothetical protein